MIYPELILPSPRYKLITCDLYNYNLIRHVDSVDKLVDDATGLLQQKHICQPKQRAADLSANFLGIFKPEYIYIKLTEEGKVKYNDYCPPDIEIEIPIHEKHYTLNKQRQYWYLTIGRINSQIVEYKNKENIPETAICFVQHTPMKWNYWHFSIRWKICDKWWHEFEEKEKDKGWSQRLGHEARSLVAMYSTTIDPIEQILDEMNYLAKIPAPKIQKKNLNTGQRIGRLLKKIWNKLFTSNEK